MVFSDLTFSPLEGAKQLCRYIGHIRSFRNQSIFLIRVCTDMHSEPGLKSTEQQEALASIIQQVGKTLDVAGGLESPNEDNIDTQICQCVEMLTDYHKDYLACGQAPVACTNNKHHFQDLWDTAKSNDTARSRLAAKAHSIKPREVKHSEKRQVDFRVHWFQESIHYVPGYELREDSSTAEILYKFSKRGKKAHDFSISLRSNPHLYLPAVSEPSGGPTEDGVLVAAGTKGPSVRLRSLPLQHNLPETRAKCVIHVCYDQPPFVVFQAREHQWFLNIYHKNQCPSGVLRDFSGALYDAPKKLRDFAGSVSTGTTVEWGVTSTWNGQDRKDGVFTFRRDSGGPLEDKICDGIRVLMTQVSRRNPNLQVPPTESSKFSLLKIGFRPASKPASETPVSMWTVHCVPSAPVDRSCGGGLVRQRVSDYEKRAGWRP